MEQNGTEWNMEENGTEWNIDQNGTEHGKEHNRTEMHVIWGSLTFYFMLIPGIMIGIQGLWVFCNSRKKSRVKASIDEENPLNVLPHILFEEEKFDCTELEEHCGKHDLKERKKKAYYELWKEYPLTVLLCIFCFPVGVLLVRVWSIFVVLTDNQRMIKQFDFLTTRLRGFEAFFESGPQLTLQIFVVFYTGIWTEIQLASICLSLFTLSRAAVLSDMLVAKVKDTKIYMASVFPLYFSSVVFKVGSLALTMIYLRYYAIIPIVLSLGMNCGLAYNLKFCLRDSLELAFCNMTVVYVGPSESKERSSGGSRFKFMMFSTLISIGIFDIILVILAVLFNTNSAQLIFWKEILINPTEDSELSLPTLNFIIGILIQMSFVNFSLFVAAKYTKLSQTGGQCLNEVGNIINKIDDLDNPEIKSEEVFEVIQNVSHLLSKPCITEFKSVKVIEQIEYFCTLFHDDKCKGVDKTSTNILEASNNLNKVINAKQPGVSTSNILHKISGLTRLLPKSEDKKTIKQVTDLKVFDEMRKIRRLLKRPEIEISSVRILDEVKELIQLLDMNNATLEKHVGTGKRILDGIKSLRTLLKNPNIEVSTPQLLFEIQGITDVLNRSDLAPASKRDEKKISESMRNLRGKIEDINAKTFEGNHSEDILEATNLLYD
eukprot:GFUD01007706.1.p1 GENE.GFUD01007706.1~~GFUD01007706.1.p1  ORF type:complete len:660 (+),score=114.07 GFUD01007706.1:367-2346(+)